MWQECKTALWKDACLVFRRLNTQSFLRMTRDLKSAMTHFPAAWHTFDPVDAPPDCSKECRPVETVWDGVGGWGVFLHVSLTDPQSQSSGCDGMMNGEAVQNSGAHILMPGVKRFSRQLHVLKNKARSGLRGLIGGSVGGGDRGTQTTTQKL